MCDRHRSGYEGAEPTNSAETRREFMQSATVAAGALRVERAAGRSASVCGEMAGDPVFTRLLLAMGLRSFSMHPRQIAQVKQAVLRSDASRLAADLSSVLEAEEPQAAAAELFGAGAS